MSAKIVMIIIVGRRTIVIKNDSINHIHSSVFRVKGTRTRIYTLRALILMILLLLIIIIIIIIS